MWLIICEFVDDIDDAFYVKDTAMYDENRFIYAY